MTRDEVLTVWLVMMDYQFVSQDDPSFYTPNHIQAALIEKGWLVQGPENWKGQTEVDITEAGNAVVDLHGADFGLDAFEGVK